MHTPYGYFEPPLNNESLLDRHVSRALQWCEHIMLDFSEVGRPIRVDVRDGEPSIMCPVNGHVIELLPFEAARSVYGPEHTRFNDQVVPLKLDGVDWPWISFTASPPSSAPSCDMRTRFCRTRTCDRHEGSHVISMLPHFGIVFHRPRYDQNAVFQVLIGTSEASWPRLSQGDSTILQPLFCK